MARSMTCGMTSIVATLRLCLLSSPLLMPLDECVAGGIVINSTRTKSRGLAGLAAAVGYGVYSFKNRGKMSTSVYLMQFRVISQGIAVGAITVGMAYSLYNNHFNKPKKNDLSITGNVTQS